MSDPTVSSAENTAQADSTDSSDAGASAYLQQLQSLQAEQAETRQRAEGLEGKLKESGEFITRIKDAVTGKEAAPVDEEQSFLDTFLEASLEDKTRGGKGMPLTTKLAVGLAEQMKANKDLRNEIKAIKEALENQNNPETYYDKQAYTWLDTEIQNGLQSIYGRDNPHIKNQFQAVVAGVNDEIRNLRQTRPAVWAEIRRNPESMKSMAMEFVERAVPPKAREILANERAKNTPMTRQDLIEANEEAKKIQDPAQRAKAKEAIRQQMLVNMYRGKDS